MPKRQGKITQDPRVAIGVVIVMVVFVAFRLPALLDATRPSAAERTAEPGEARAMAVEAETELPPPPDLGAVAREVDKCREVVRADLSGANAAPSYPRGENLRNPFRTGRATPPPPAPPKARKKTPARARPVEDLVCEAVFLGSNACALLSGEIYSLGDEVNGLRIEKIDSDGVELRGRGETVKLPVNRAENSERSSLVFKPTVRDHGDDGGQQ